MPSVINASPINVIVEASPINSVVKAENICVVISAESLISIAFDSSSIPNFDSNGEAIAGGLGIGDLYRNSDNKILVVIEPDDGSNRSSFWLNFSKPFSLLRRFF